MRGSQFIGNVRPSGLSPDYILVSGSRGFDDYLLLARVLDRLTESYACPTLIVGDGYKSVWDMQRRDYRKIGADWHALAWAEYHWYTRWIYNAEWQRHGKRAGMVRNAEMVEFAAEQGCEMFVAFWDGDSPGTAHTIELARKWLPKFAIHIVKYED